MNELEAEATADLGDKGRLAFSTVVADFSSGNPSGLRAPTSRSRSGPSQTGEQRRVAILAALAVEPLSGAGVRVIVGGASDRVQASLLEQTADGLVLCPGVGNHPSSRWSLA